MAVKGLQEELVKKDQQIKRSNEDKQFLHTELQQLQQKLQVEISDCLKKTSTITDLQHALEQKDELLQKQRVTHQNEIASLQLVVDQKEELIRKERASHHQELESKNQVLSSRGTRER